MVFISQMAVNKSFYKWQIVESQIGECFWTHNSIEAAENESIHILFTVWHINESSLTCVQYSDGNHSKVFVLFGIHNIHICTLSVCEWWFLSCRVFSRGDSIFSSKRMLWNTNATSNSCCWNANIRLVTWFNAMPALFQCTLHTLSPTVSDFVHTFTNELDIVSICGSTLSMQVHIANFDCRKIDSIHDCNA